MKYGRPRIAHRNAELNSTCRPVSGLVSGSCQHDPTDRLPTYYAVAKWSAYSHLPLRGQRRNCSQGTHRLPVWSCPV